MKRVVFTTLIILVTFNLYSQKIALHTAGGPLFFSGTNALADAYNASSPGDTIYLPGGSFTPPSFIDKKLTIVGAGHYPDSTAATGKTFINGEVILKDNADGFLIEGVEITSNLSFEYDKSINQVTIRRCKVNGQVLITGAGNYSQNIALVGSVFIGHVYLGNARNVMVSNNIIQYGIDATEGNQIYNNIFLSRLTNGYYENYRGSNNKLYNNIFLLQGSYGMTSGSGNEYYNNLMAYANPSYGTNSTTVGNYTAVDPAAVFISQSGNTFSYDHSYHLQSPELYKGYDNAEAGIYGGSFPYKDGAVPFNPHIQFKDIATTTDSNGDLTINIRISAQE